MTKETIQYKNIIAGISVFMLFLAIPKLPYGYYILLRWVVTISALFSVWVAYDSEDKFWVFLMVGIAILFNPIIPVHLTKDIWVIIDLIVAILFLVSIFHIKPERKPREKKKIQKKIYLPRTRLGVSPENSGKKQQKEKNRPEISKQILGVAYHNKGMYDEAIVEYKKAIERRTGFAEAHHGLGTTYYRKGEYSLAIKHYDKAMGLGSSVDSELLEFLEQYREN